MKLLANLSVKLTEQISFTLKKIDHLHGDFIFNNIFFFEIPDKTFSISNCWVWQTEKGSENQNFCWFGLLLR